MMQKLEPYNYQVVGLILAVAMLQKVCEDFVIKLLIEQASEEVIWRNIIFITWGFSSWTETDIDKTYLTKCLKPLGTYKATYKA